MGNQAIEEKESEEKKVREENRKEHKRKSEGIGKSEENE